MQQNNLWVISNSTVAVNRLVLEYPQIRIYFLFLPPKSKILPKRVYFECFLSTYLPILNYLCTPVSCWSGPRGMHTPRLWMAAIAEFSKLNTLQLNNWLLGQNMTCKNWFFKASPNVHSLIWRSEKVAMDGSFLHWIDLLSFISNYFLCDGS